MLQAKEARLIIEMLLKAPSSRFWAIITFSTLALASFVYAIFKGVI